MSTQFAHASGRPVVAVQHHHAHIASCMAENQVRGPALGIAWDGSGFGPDGTVWGGEFLRVDDAGYARVAHLRTFRLPGGERAVREPRRVGFALLFEIFGEEAFALDLPCVRALSARECATLSTMLKEGVNSPLTSSAGRLFDAFAALLGLRQIARFEGQAAMELEAAATGVDEDQAYPFAVREAGGLLVLDWEPAVRALLADRLLPVARAAARFHNTLVEMGVEVARRVGEPKVILSGGCFQNRYLTERFISRLQVSGCEPYWQQRVPPNDGGIALGQLVVAARAGRD